MKTILILLSVGIFPIVTSAQRSLKPMDDITISPIAPTQPTSENSTTITKYKGNRVLQSIGKIYNEEDLNHLAIRNINGVAATVAGVDSRAGTQETPNIRGGGASGTAYFVDGVRTYGALPILSK
jgi:hypothetical protein